MTGYWTDQILDALAQCTPKALTWAAAGYRGGLADGFLEGFRAGYRASETEVADAWTEVATSIRAGASTPQQAALRALRDEPDYQPCPARCDACSRCVASRAYWARGGRRYQGAQVEQFIAEQQQRGVA